MHISSIYLTYNLHVSTNMNKADRYLYIYIHILYTLIISLNFPCAHTAAIACSLKNQRNPCHTSDLRPRLLAPLHAGPLDGACICIYIYVYIYRDVDILRCSSHTILHDLDMHLGLKTVCWIHIPHSLVARSNNGTPGYIDHFPLKG